MPIALAEDYPRRPSRWGWRMTRYVVPLTLILGLVLVLHVPRLRTGHALDELSADVGVPDIASTAVGGRSQQPYILPGSQEQPYTSSKEERPVGSAELALAQIRPKRVAIVGAGASGSAAAFFLRRAARIMEERIGVPEGQLLGDVVVVDKEAYVGGRSTTVYPHGNTSLVPVELGASIFVDANKNLVKAARLFNLTAAAPDFGSSGVGIWNGTHFLYTTSTSKGLFSGWWDALSAVFRYGPLSPYRTNSAVAALLKKFALLYNPKFLSEEGAAWTIAEMVERVGLGRDMTTRRGDEWALREVGVGDRWMGEIMEGSTRVNYARDMSDIHALGAAVSMATDGAKAVQGGNWQIFDGMLKNASATVVLGTQVTDILPFISEAGIQQFQLRTNTTLLTDPTANAAESAQTGGSERPESYTDAPFDSIIFAAPWHLSPIAKSMDHYFTEAIPSQSYVHLHVTLLTTTSPRPDPLFFGMKQGSVLPNTILTSAYDVRLAHNGSRVAATDEESDGDGDQDEDERAPRFQSISWHDETSSGSGEYVVKIFSLDRLSDDVLEGITGSTPTWVLRKEWDSYPALKPIRAYAPVEPFKGFHYLAALEPWVSTMETQTLSAREAVARIVSEWWGMGYGECRGGADAWDWTCGNT